MFTLYGSPKTRSARAAWTLEEAGADWTYQRVALQTGGGRAPDFLALNPAGKVPVLVDTGCADGPLVLTESAAICRWIAERHPAAGLLPPPGTAARARCEEALVFAVCELEQPLWSLAKHTFALPEKLRVKEMLSVAPKEFSRALAVLAKRLGDSPYIAGDTFSVADILTGHTLAWAQVVGQPIDAPSLIAYAERVLARPALARAAAREAAG